MKAKPCLPLMIVIINVCLTQYLFLVYIDYALSVLKT